MGTKEDPVMDDVVNRLIRELPDTAKDRYDLAYRRGRAQARSSMLFGGMTLGFLAGAGIMFLLDPDHGRSRRAELGQRLGALGRDVQRTAEGRRKDLRNRAVGAATELGLPGTPPSNEEIREDLAATREPTIPRPVPRSAAARSPSPAERTPVGSVPGAGPGGAEG
jgi:hypothetical protein